MRWEKNGKCFAIASGIDASGKPVSWVDSNFPLPIEWRENVPQADVSELIDRLKCYAEENGFSGIA